jgi:hypothetical protein
MIKASTKLITAISFFTAIIFTSNVFAEKVESQTVQTKNLGTFQIPLNWNRNIAATDTITILNDSLLIEIQLYKIDKKDSGQFLLKKATEMNISKKIRRVHKKHLKSANAETGKFIQGTALSQLDKKLSGYAVVVLYTSSKGCFVFEGKAMVNSEDAAQANKQALLISKIERSWTLEK